MSIIEFNVSGFPHVKLHEDFFEVKAIDYWEFRSFRYDEVIKISYYDLKDVWMMHHTFSLPHRVKIYKSNGADWTYDAGKEHSNEFAELLRQIVKRCGLDCKIKRY